jgi:hypothetical protein
MVRRLELITLPLRAAVLLVLVGLGYYLGFGNPSEESRTESDTKGVVARYTRDGRPWRIFYDRNRDRKWDMWIDERGGSPILVSVDIDGDGRADVDQDEFGRNLPAWRSAEIRAMKTAGEFVRNPRQLQYTGLAVMVYILLEFLSRSRSG